MPDKKLLVADDSLTIQKVIRLALSNEGYEIQTVSNGADAIQQIATFRPHVVLIDISLPKKSAFEVKKEINQHSDLSAVHFVLMSSAFEKIDEVQMKEARFHGSLSKPFDPAHLRAVLGTVFGQAQASSSSSSSSPPSQSPNSELAPPPEPTGGTLVPPLPPGWSAPKPPQMSKEAWNKDMTSFPPPVPFQKTSSGTGTIAPKASPSSSGTTSISLSSVKTPSSEESSTQGVTFGLKQDRAEKTDGRFSRESGLNQNQESSSDSPTSMESPDLPESPEPNEELDIQKLTESTMKFETTDFDWKVNETSLSPSPPSFSPPSVEELGGSSYIPPEFPSAPETYSEPPAIEPSAPFTELPPSLPPSFRQSALVATQPPATVPPPFDKDPSYEIQSTVRPTDKVESPGTNTDSGDSITSAPVLSGPTPEETDRKIREAVETHLREAVSKILPDLAEKLIKEEIHRMLNES